MKHKVLLVNDDDASLLRSLGNSFAAETFEVVLAENVEQAIEKSEAGEIELLLMKLDLQAGEGWEAILEITEENPFLPIIVVTRQPGLRALAEAAGACALVEAASTFATLTGNFWQKPLERVRWWRSRSIGQCLCRRYASCWRNRSRAGGTRSVGSTLICVACRRPAKTFARCWTDAT